MARLITSALMILALSACISNGESQQASVNWDDMQKTTKVANVAGIRSLIRPGIY